MSRNSKLLSVKLLRTLPKYQNLVIAFLLANAFSLGLGLLIGENLRSGGLGINLGGNYQKVTVQEIQASTSSKPVLGASQIGAKININAASLIELDSLPGIGLVYAQKIVSGRPYRQVLDLVTKKIVPLSLYGKIKDRISAE